MSCELAESRESGRRGRRAWTFAIPNLRRGKGVKNINPLPTLASQNQRGRAPWLEVEATMTASGVNDAVGAFIARTVRKLTASYYSFAP